MTASFLFYAGIPKRLGVSLGAFLRVLKVVRFVRYVRV